MYIYEEVKKDEGISLAKEIGAIYRRTSAKDIEGGVDELFKNIGQLYLDPNSDIASNMTKEELKKRGEKIRRDNIKNNNNGKKVPKRCC